MESGVQILGGVKRSSRKMKKSGKKSGKKATPAVGITKRPHFNMPVKLSAGAVADEISALRKKYNGGDPHLLMVDRMIPSLRLLGSDDLVSSNARLLGMLREVMDTQEGLYASDVEYVDLRQRLNDVKLDSNPDHAEVDHQDLLNVSRVLLKQMILKQRPMVKVYDYGRAVSKGIKDFVKNMNTQCPPINEPNKTESFYDADGFPGCRVPMSKRTPTKGVAKCPPFPGSRRTQLHVQADNTAVCREPVRTGAHECPEVIYKDPMDEENTAKWVYVDPLAIVHETLPGGVGVCKRPFSTPNVLFSSPSVMPANFDASIKVQSNVGRSAARPAARTAARPAAKRSPKRSPRRASPRRVASPARRGSKNRV
jgi:hypothetical protein